MAKDELLADTFKWTLIKATASQPAGIPPTLIDSQLHAPVERQAGKHEGRIPEVGVCESLVY